MFHPVKIARVTARTGQVAYYVYATECYRVALHEQSDRTEAAQWVKSGACERLLAEREPDSVKSTVTGIEEVFILEK